MNDRLRNLRLLLEREREKFGSWLRPLTGAARKLAGGRRRVRRLRAPPARGPSAPAIAPVAAAASPGPGRPPPGRWLSFRGLSLSLLAHGMILWLILLHEPPQARPGGPGAPGETVLSVRLRPPAPRGGAGARRQPRNGRAARPPATPAPEPPPGPAPSAELASPQPGAGAAAPADRGDAGGKSTALGARLPSALGLGGTPPPLPTPGQGKGGAGGGYSSRLDGKGEALGRHGGTRETEGAVERGLLWLAEHQDEDGGWSAEGFRRHCRHFLPCPGEGLAEFDVGVSALAFLAFLGAGHLPDEPGTYSFAARHPSPYRRQVKKAADYLLAHQDGSGAFGASGKHYNYNHAIATLAMAEAFYMTGFRRYAESVQAAVGFIARSQQTRGGWDYTAEPTGRNDLSVTAWQVMALRAAQDANLEVPQETVDAARRYAGLALTADGEGIYADLGQEAGRRGPNMSAAGLLSRLYLGAFPTEQSIRRAAARLLHAPPDWSGAPDWERTFQSYYYWYTATLALFHLGGEEWKAWNHFLQRTLLPLQSRRPHEEGSWPPEENWLGISGGRVYSTAMGVLLLETYYRYSPITRSSKG